MNETMKTRLAIAGVILVVVVAGLVILKTATAPRETVGNFKAIPAKGAGRFDRD